MAESDCTTEPSSFGRWLMLIGMISAITVVWCVALPKLAEQPRVQEHLVFLDSKGIDPSAMFYTELDAMDEILKRIENR